MREKKEEQKQIRVRRFISGCLMFFTMVLVLSEVITFAIWAMPLICLQVWQMSGLGSLAAVAVKDITVTNITVMCMMWLLPCLFLCGICFYLHCKLLRYLWNKLKKWFVVLREKPCASKKE